MKTLLLTCLSKEEYNRFVSNFEMIKNETIQNENNFKSLVNNCKLIVGEINRILSDDDFTRIVENALIKRTIEDDTISLFYDDNSRSKLLEINRKKQYNAKILQSLLTYIKNILMLAGDESIEKIAYYLLSDIESLINDYVHKLTIDKYSVLKTKLDQICAGVKQYVYVDLEKNNYNYNDDKVINLFYKYNINYNRFNDSLYKKEMLNLIKNIFGQEFNFLILINSVIIYNDESHAEKILLYFINEIKKMDNGEFILKEQLPLVFVLDFKNILLGTCYNYITNYILKYYDFELCDDYKGLIYPLNNVDFDKIKNGKQIFENLIKQFYEDNYTSFMDIFNNLNNVVKKHPVTTTIRDYIDICNRQLYNANEIKKLALHLNDKFDDDENVYNRFYFMIYVLSSLYKNEFKDILYNYLYHLFSYIELEYGIKCKYLYNDEKREVAYKELKELLSKYDVNISDSYKEDYIIALLDKKCASILESYRFPEFEMLGDRIYSFALEELKFYQEDLSIMENINISALEQLKVVKYLGIDKLYICHNKENNEEESYDSHKYYADSLEMILGVICLDLGYEKAIEFAKRIICNCYNIKYYPSYNVKSFNETFDIDNPYYFEINNIRLQDDASQCHFGIAIMNLVTLLVLGSDTEEKRIFSSNSLLILYSNNIFNSYYYSGLDATIDSYRKIILDKFSNNK